MPPTPGPDAASTPSPPPHPRRHPWKLPPWLDHFNARDLKMLLRCWTAAWVAMMLVFVGPAFDALGVATFFASLLLFIVPPATILFVYLLAAFSLMLGMCLAWAWGLLAMKAALAARPDAETAAAFHALQQQAVLRANQTGQAVAWEAVLLTDDGFMLDARVTAVYFVMCCLFIYALARLRCANAKLVLLQLFGTIAIDLFLLYGPVLPTFTPRLPVVLVKPAAVGVGLGIACCVLFFPQSSSYVVLGQMEQLLRLGDAALDLTRAGLDKEPLRLADLKAAKSRMIGVSKAIEPILAFLPLDFSRGRWNADDVKSLQPPIREAMLASLSLLDLQAASVKAAEKGEKLALWEAPRDAGAEVDIRAAGQRQLVETSDLWNALKSPEHGAMRDRALEALRDTTGDILQACSRSNELAARCINTVNTRRWIRRPSQREFDELADELEDLLATLRAARVTCVADATEAVLDSHADLFDDDGQLKHPEKLDGPLSLHGIVISMVVEERILGAALAAERLLEQILRLVRARTTHRLWLPSRLQYAVSWLFDGHLTVPISSTDDVKDPDALADDESLEEQAEELHRRLRLSRGRVRPPRHASWLSRALVGTFRWLFNPAGLYALRMVVVTVVTAIPAVIPHSAGFFYREKGIWGVITAQTCLLVYMADFTFSLVSRGLGTVLGGVMGMVAWYVGSGSGIGNPYGMGASTAVVTVILMWWRIFLPPAYMQASAMTGATFALVVGFSWDQNHIRQDGLPGLGYEAFWKRVVTVLLGFVAAAVVQLFPKPPSATKHVRRTLARTVRTLSDHYALLLSHWGHADRASPLGAAAEQLSLQVAETLLSLDETIALLRFELSFGPFDQKVLRETQEQCQHMNQSLGRLLDLATSLPRDLQDRLVERVGILDDGVIGDVMAVLGLIEQALRTASPLPERLPTPLVRRFYDSWHQQHRGAMLSRSLVRDENYRRYCVAASAYLKFLSTIDDLVLQLKAVLGECHVIHQWDREEA
ncbi:hypothetical protein DCS_01986 [Drechmeria coniospora]|uniref:Protein (Fungal and plant) n=1 Tax=Drechmeria coniospora TaxID=98403 RepID=A0A151GUT9_DRECN|nr:hypothetical protein DCS_01986 [Drechmeria coniospora]KYK60848.1 hypothetical protein DCS_01986 [Drechmeria coniospora]